MPDLCLVGQAVPGRTDPEPGSAKAFLPLEAQGDRNRTRRADGTQAKASCKEIRSERVEDHIRPEEGTKQTSSHASRGSRRVNTARGETIAQRGG